LNQTEVTKRGRDRVASHIPKRSDCSTTCTPLSVFLTKEFHPPNCCVEAGQETAAQHLICRCYSSCRKQAVSVQPHCDNSLHGSGPTPSTDAPVTSSPGAMRSTHEPVMPSGHVLSDRLVAPRAQGRRGDSSCTYVVDIERGPSLAGDERMRALGCEHESPG